MQNIELILKEYANVPLEHQVLVNTLKRYYESPKDKIDSLVKKGEIVRLKKGWYVVSCLVTDKPYCLGSIANNLHGPSYVSLETALAYYGLIPEAVYATLSVTTKRKKQLKNEIGRFEYYTIPPALYPIGIDFLIESDCCSYLIASPEKAICDVLYRLRGHRIRSIKAMREFLFDDMRIDFDSFENINLGIIDQVIESGIKKVTFELLREVLSDECSCRQNDGC